MLATFPRTEDVILLDLRRMNRILEINEKNMFAVVEPYVVSAQLQSELMKRGLNCNVIGAGAHTSALPLAAFWGTGHMGQSTSNGERNLLAVEWVTPEGEIVRLGSLGSLGEWFCGDGPGTVSEGYHKGCYHSSGGNGCIHKSGHEGLSLAGTFRIHDGRGLSAVCTGGDTPRISSSATTPFRRSRGWMRHSAR